MTSLTNQKLALETANEARAMASHALSGGRPVPGWVLETIARADEGVAPHVPVEEGGGERQGTTVRDIYRAHAELSRLIAPFTPDLIVLLEMEAKVSGFAKALGQIRITRIFVVIVILSVCTFLGISVSSYINDPLQGNIFEAWGFPLFVNEMFFLSAAAVGASFSNLFRLDRELSHGSFLPKDQSSYWVQFTLGIVAGLLLSTLLNVSSVAPKDDAAQTSMQFRGAALALVGGFSSSVVQRIIQRLIESMEAILRGGAEQEVRGRQAAHKMRLEEALAKDRMNTTLLLVEMQRKLGAGTDPESLRAQIDEASQSALTSGIPAPDPFDQAAVPRGAGDPAEQSR